MVVEEDDEPLGLLDEDAPPPVPTLPDAEPEMPLPDEDVPPVPPVVELELDPGGVGADDVVEDEDDEPPGTTTVSFSLVVELVELDDPLGAAPPGTTVVVSLRSHAASARAPIRTNT